MDEGDLEHQGLSNTKALAILYDQLSALLSEHKKRQKERTWKDIRLINESALFIFLVINLSAIGLQQWLKSQEIPQRVQAILQRINVLIRTPEFGMNDFCYELYNPPLDSICLQWTYRDGQLVNLPTSLLVEGDIIALRPGQKAPTSLRGIEDEEHVILDRDDIFCQFSSPPSPVQNKRSHTHSLLKPHPFKVTKTPMVENIQRCLELGQQRPVTVLNNERFTAQRLLQKYIAPMVLVNGVLPLLPLSFPIIWFLVNIYGEAQMVALLQKPTANFKENWIETWRMFWATIRGRAPALCQTSSLLHNLGSITVLCCVDKQGILSWPSSCPDKVFFFTDAWRRAKPQDKNLTASISVKTAPSTHCTVQRGNEHPELLSNAVMADHQTNFAIEMLSLSQNQQDATHIWFDDSNWQEHSPSLRPLGLSILLGLCDPTSAARVFQMTDHLSHIALKKSRWSCLPVQISGGLCELPRIIGFTSSARNLFHKQTYTAAYTSTAMTNTQEASPWEPSFITKRKLPLRECIALSYKPVFHTLQSSDDETSPQVSLKTKSYSQADTSAALDLEELTFDQEDNLHPLDNQILLGLISSQYQARLDMVHLIDGLDNTCIRFVYFSLENELKSKEFAEKMGLETGWNCHISLQSNSFVLEPDHLMPTSQNIVEQQDSEIQRLMREDGSLPETDGERTPGSNTCSFMEDLNRAKLPRGIENIRPHLEHVDNVPLLVPLFTDCTAEYVFVVTTALVLASMAQLPPPLGTTDVLCLTCVYFPLVSMSLMGKPPDNTVMEVATGKNLKILPKKTQWFFVLYFLVKSGLTVCLQLTCFGLMLHGFCMKEQYKTNFSCHPFGPFMNSSYVSPNWFDEYGNALMLAQKIVAFFILLHGLCTSMSHVHRSNPLWKQSPLSNRWWCAAVIIAFLLHVIQINVAYHMWDNKSSHLVFHILDIPAATWLLGFLWLLPLMAINEFLKLHEIRMRVHYQKKQKLQFDTKLGMNSPF
ncbi:hypothetical protein chiPu_0009932 [Chiloscyllium punctatum]|uniref:Cation-transporting P-type ATPase C-terminal domain-containing protein n=1 Tax=Chiloscyllium punctatum TaxID=137246 RepID=A0A401SM40_CHIPU|nr:hypothetical protein [Chiloscyllium punctatum]